MKNTIEIRPIDQQRAGRLVLGLFAKDNDAALRVVVEAAISTDGTSTAALIFALGQYAAELARTISGDEAEALMVAALLDLSNDR